MPVTQLRKRPVEWFSAEVEFVEVESEVEVCCRKIDTLPVAALCGIVQMCGLLTFED